MGWFRRRDKRAAEEAAEQVAPLQARIAELESLLEARERELAAAYADVDAASAELEASAVAVRDALAVIDAIEEERDGGPPPGKAESETDPDEEAAA